MKIDDLLKTWPKSRSTIAMGEQDWRVARLHEMLPGLDPEKLCDLFLNAEYHEAQKRMVDEWMGYAEAATLYPIMHDRKFPGWMQSLQKDAFSLKMADIPWRQKP